MYILMRDVCAVNVISRHVYITWKIYAFWWSFLAGFMASKLIERISFIISICKFLKMKNVNMQIVVKPFIISLHVDNCNKLSFIVLLLYTIMCLFLCNTDEVSRIQLLNCKKEKGKWYLTQESRKIDIVFLFFRSLEYHFFRVIRSRI